MSMCYFQVSWEGCYVLYLVTQTAPAIHHRTGWESLVSEQGGTGWRMHTLKMEQNAETKLAHLTFFKCLTTAANFKTHICDMNWQQPVTYRGCGWSATAQSWWRSPVWRRWWLPLFLCGTGSWLSRCHRCWPYLMSRWSDCHGLPPEHQPVATGHCCRTPGLLFVPLQQHKERVGLYKMLPE